MEPCDQLKPRSPCAQLEDEERKKQEEEKLPLFSSPKYLLQQRQAEVAGVTPHGPNVPRTNRPIEGICPYSAARAGQG